MRRFVLATRNSGKIREIRRALAELPVEVVSLENWPDLPEPVEDGRTFTDNARLKARYYSRATGLWALADDSGLEVDALNRAPGVYSARYAANDLAPEASRDRIDEANNDKVLASLGQTPDAERTARFICHMALADGERILLETEGRLEGRIARRRCGENGFGYDPIFYVPELGCTTAELDTEAKNRISHRGQAVRAFVGQVGTLLAGREAPSDGPA